MIIGLANNRCRNKNEMLVQWIKVVFFQYFDTVIPKPPYKEIVNTFATSIAY